MFGNTIIFESDERQRYLAEYLPGRKQQLCHQSLQIPYFVDRMQEADCIVLPTPVSRMDEYPLYFELISEYLVNWNGVVFGGKIQENWQEMLEANEVTYYDFLMNESVALENAYITAEATLSLMIQKGLYSIRGQKVVITGYGRCARELAKLLSKIGAQITILARSSAARIRAKDEGYEAVDFSYGPEEICGAGAVINTVPSFVFTDVMLRELHEDTLFIDIASKPGGVDPKMIEKYPHEYFLELGLPSRFTQKSSGKILADMILGLRQSPNKEIRKECPWILQILL